MLLNFLVFQLAWFATVFGAAKGLPWVGPIVIALAIALHLHKSNRASPEVALIAWCAAIGLVMDSLLIAVGWVSYPNGMWTAFAAPYWIVAMWMLFATTLNVSLAWLKPRKRLGFVFGLLGGPLAYYSGFKLGAINLLDPSAALLALSIGWAVIVPVLLSLADRLDGFGDPVAPPGAEFAVRS